MSAAKRPFRSQRGDYVLEAQERDGVWYVHTGANTEAKLRAEMRKYRYGHTFRITSNRPGDPLPADSYRP